MRSSRRIDALLCLRDHAERNRHRCLPGIHDVLRRIGAVVVDDENVPRQRGRVSLRREMPECEIERLGVVVRADDDAEGDRGHHAALGANSAARLLPTAASANRSSTRARPAAPSAENCQVEPGS
jgi:hypothetical protein